jgi:hypothetical protein
VKLSTIPPQRYEFGTAPFSLPNFAALLESCFVPCFYKLHAGLTDKALHKVPQFPALIALTFVAVPIT